MFYRRAYAPEDFQTIENEKLSTSTTQESDSTLNVEDVFLADKVSFDAKIFKKFFCFPISFIKSFSD